MKRIILLIALSILIFGIAGGILVRNRGARAMRVPINIEDLPDYGLTLIGPSDPSFEENVSAILRGRKDDVVNALKAFSVVMKNTNDKAVVAYRLEWEMTRSDGTVVTRESGGANQGALMDGGPPGWEHIAKSNGYAIPPNSKRFVSTGFSLGEGQAQIVGSHAGGSDNPDDLPRILEAARSKDAVSMVNIANSELQSYKSITVSVDGAFFEDGTFVGPDTTNFFANVQAITDAKRDLLQEVAFRQAHGKTSQDIFSDISETANGGEIQLGKGSSTTDYYNFYKKVFAKEIVGMRQSLGDDKAILLALQPLRKQWPRLRKSQ